MSTPISNCLIFKAALGDEKAFDHLVEAMEYNRAWGAYTQFPCRCKPPCPVPDMDQLVALNVRMAAVMKQRRQERAKHAKPVTFDKIVFPVIKGMGTNLPSLEEIFTKPPHE